MVQIIISRRRAEREIKNNKSAIYNIAIDFWHPQNYTKQSIDRIILPIKFG